jgi:hypothetical protein
MKYWLTTGNMKKYCASDYCVLKHLISIGQLSLRLLMQINHTGLGILAAANAMRRQLT